MGEKENKKKEKEIKGFWDIEEEIIFLKVRINRETQPAAKANH